MLTFGTWYSQLSLSVLLNPKDFTEHQHWTRTRSLCDLTDQGKSKITSVILSVATWGGVCGVCAWWSLTFTISPRTGLGTARGSRSPGPGTMIARISANRWIGQVVLGRGTTMQGVLSSP